MRDTINALEMETYIADHKKYLSSSGQEGKLIDITDSLIQNAILIDTDLTSAVFREITFRQCLLYKVEFYDSIMTEVVFENCVFDEGMISNLDFFQGGFKNCIFRNFEFIKTTLIDSLLENNVFIRCHMEALDVGKNATILNNTFITSNSELEFFKQIQSSNNLIFQS